MILKTLFTLLTLVSLNVFAAPPKLVGTFAWNGKYDIAQVRDDQVVNISNPTGRQRYSVLRLKYGYTCQNIMAQRVKCYKFLEPILQHPSHDSDIYSYSLKDLIDFKQPESDWEQTNDSELLKEWNINQTVIFIGLGSFNQIRYLEIPGANKMAIGSYWFNQVENNMWAYTPGPIKINHQYGVYTYMVEYLIDMIPQSEQK